MYYLRSVERPRKNRKMMCCDWDNPQVTVKTLCIKRYESLDKLDHFLGQGYRTIATERVTCRGCGTSRIMKRAITGEF